MLLLAEMLLLADILLLAKSIGHNITDLDFSKMHLQVARQ